MPVPLLTVVHDMDPLLALSEPWLGPLTTANVRPVLSMSLPLKVISTAVSSAVLTDWLAATGGSLTAVTVIVTVATLLSFLPSLAL